MRYCMTFFHKFQQIRLKCVSMIPKRILDFIQIIILLKARIGYIYFICNILSTKH